MEQNENRKFDRVGQGVVAPQQSIPDQIAQLADLHRQGVLTAEEFEAKKRQLLDRL
jgi:predicted Zn-dependent peptidase